ncbi:hypothetical protein [Arthrobacter sp. NicSoilC5]|uniref:hypothetical protein n=1 Tax=Arthrobacter sp. NicSoilC5 TaxID=2831000 RepID=UPI001CC3C181|nr:hypothetical protein [Arthrobacter sp. NicSoilC5]
MPQTKGKVPQATQQGNSTKQWIGNLSNPLLIALISALVGASSALLVAGIGAVVTTQTVQQQLQAEKEKEHREKTPAVYTSYLDSAKRYRAAQMNLATYSRSRGIQNPDSTQGRAMSLSDPAVKDLLLARDAAATDYESAIDNLAVYGSDEAWNIHKKIAAGLTPSKVIDADGDGVDETGFGNYMDDLRIEFCETVSLKGEACHTRRLAPEFVQAFR